jgi:1-acyl-sn-glycerol-3-phosphate acyltransferase
MAAKKKKRTQEPRAKASGLSETQKQELEVLEHTPEDQDQQDHDEEDNRQSLVAEISAYVPPVDDDALDNGIPSIIPRETREMSGDVDAELRAVEAEVDRIFHEQSKRPRRDSDGPLSNVVNKIREVLPVELPGENGDLVDAAKDVLSTDYYLRQWGRIGLRNRSEEVDEFGLDPVYEQRLRPVLDFLYKNYFRTEVSGIENVPADGRCIIVSNHSGVLPYDGMMVRTAMRREHPSQREVRWLAEDFIFHLPFVGAFMNRIGAVRACQENAERLLRQERCVLVFPEGIKGIGKLYNQKYKLQRFGRGGFIKLALRTGAPIIPLSIVGAEEAAPMLYRIEYLTQALGLPFIPVTPTFPALGPLGLLPAPTKWKLTFGPPIDLEGHGAAAADDALLVVRLAERVRTAIQKSLDQTVESRKSVWFG